MSQFKDAWYIPGIDYSLPDICNRNLFYSDSFTWHFRSHCMNRQSLTAAPIWNLSLKYCSHLQNPSIGAMAIYTFINAWNMYMWPLLVTGSSNMRTVQIGISMLDSIDSQSVTMMIAGVVMIIIPSISIFYHRTETIDPRYVLRSRKGLTVYIKSKYFLIKIVKYLLYVQHLCPRCNHR